MVVQAMLEMKVIGSHTQGFPPPRKNKFCRRVRVTSGALVQYAQNRDQDSDMEVSSPHHPDVLEASPNVEQEDLSPFLPDDDPEHQPNIPLIMQERGWGQVVALPQAPQLIPVQYGFMIPERLEEMLGRMNMALSRAEGFAIHL